MEQIIFSPNVIKAIKDAFFNLSVEGGGIIGRCSNNVCEFLFDRCGSEYEYTPNISYLNLVISQWLERDVKFAGIVHNHLNGLRLLSENDKHYAELILKLNPMLGYVLFPLVTRCMEHIEIDVYLFDGEWSQIELKLGD